MAWSASKIMTKPLLDKLNSDNAMDYNGDAFKAALYNNTPTPDNTVTTTALSSYNGSSSQWVTANEVTDSSGWPAGGRSLASVTVAQSAAVITFDAADTTSANSTTTLASVYGCLNYDTTVSSLGLCYNYFGGTNSVTSGTFTIVWSASGVATITLT